MRACFIPVRIRAIVGISIAFFMFCIVDIFSTIAGAIIERQAFNKASWHTKIGFIVMLGVLITEYHTGAAIQTKGYGRCKTGCALFGMFTPWHTAFLCHDVDT